MRFEPIQIRANALYNFYIETWDKPDNALKERIRAQIGEAMGALGREPDSYSVSILQNSEAEESGDSEYPELKIGRNYLIFAILGSGDSAESLADKELEEQRAELARGIFPPKNSRIALVLLQDSSISLITTQKPSNARIIYF